MRSKLIYILCASIGAVIGTGWYFCAPRQYEAITLLTISNPHESADQTDPAVTLRTIEGVIPDCTKRIFSEDVLNRVLSRLPKEHRVDFKGLAKSKWLTELKSRITVSSTSSSKSASIRYLSKTPESAAVVVDAIAEALISTSPDVRSEEPNSVSDKSDDERSRFEARLREIEQELTTLKQMTRQLLYGDGAKTLGVATEPNTLDHALNDAHTRTMESRGHLVAIQGALATGSSLQPFLRQFAGEIADRERGQSQSTIVPVSSRDVTGNRTIAVDVSRSRDQETASKLLDVVRQRLSQANGHEESLRQLILSHQSEVSCLKDQMTTIEGIEGHCKELHDQFLSILGQFLNVTEASPPVDSISVAEAAKINPIPVSPNSSTTVLLGAGVGLIVGSFLNWLRLRFNGRFRSVAEMERLLELPTFAEIGPLEPLPGIGLDSLATFANEGQLETKPFRDLRTSITFSARNATRLLVTSPEAGDGKTVAVTNLAVVFAQANRKTLLIDADLTSSGTTYCLDLAGPRGLTQILRDEKPIELSCLENVFNLGIENMDVMPTGSSMQDFADRMNGERFDEMMSWAVANYDQILIDAPSMCSSRITTHIGRLAESAVIVVKIANNHRKTVSQAIQACRVAGIDPLGIVVNHHRESVEITPRKLSRQNQMSPS